MNLKENLAVSLAKLSTNAIRSLRLGLGSNLPGRIARRVAPNVLKQLAVQCRKGVLAVSGTNGKSTTCGFISSILNKAQLKIVHNRQGANLVTGITATLIDQASWQGKLDADYCLFEIDEATLPVVAAEIDIAAIVVTNLFRDQLDRFGELDTTARLIEKGIAINHSPAILNADDPNVAKLAAGSRRIYYGIESLSASASEGGETPPLQYHGAIRELSYCANCENEYAYSLLFYGQLGHWRCANCGNARPQPTVVASDIAVSASGSTFTLRLDQEVQSIKIALPGLFNVYNALAAAAMAYKIGIDAQTIKNGLENYETLFGRSERVEISGKSVLIQLIKNPSGATQVISACATDSEKQILIAINDNYADGRDISWLWDAEFERLSEHKGKVVVAGQRAEDMAVRMKYAGIDPQKIVVVSDLSQALDRAIGLTDSAETLWVMPTYTCLLELQKILAARGLALSGT
jgi:UDP-N-acetylmuramyl tripeptide synthase